MSTGTASPDFVQSKLHFVGRQGHGNKPFYHTLHWSIRPIQQFPKSRACKHPQVVATISPEAIHHFLKHLGVTISFKAMFKVIHLHLIQNNCLKTKRHISKKSKKLVNTQNNHHLKLYLKLKIHHWNWWNLINWVGSLLEYVPFHVGEKASGFAMDVDLKKLSLFLPKVLQQIT